MTFYDSPEESQRVLECLRERVLITPPTPGRQARVLRVSVRRPELAAIRPDVLMAEVWSAELGEQEEETWWEGEIKANDDGEWPDVLGAIMEAWAQDLGVHYDPPDNAGPVVRAMASSLRGEA